MYNRLQYISQGNTLAEQLKNIYNALDNGCDWIQLRYKNENTADFFRLAETVKVITEDYMATMIINDNVALAKEIDADGVHLGLKDMKIAEARIILGSDKIIGGTSNTFEDILQRAEENCDYIGLGPFRFTETKSNLSPILGLEGYKTIIEKMQEHNIKTPVYAIGGIQLNDIDDLINVGVHGFAVSGLITKQPEIITPINEKLYVNI